MTRVAKWEPVQSGDSPKSSSSDAWRSSSSAAPPLPGGQLLPVRGPGHRASRPSSRQGPWRRCTWTTPSTGQKPSARQGPWRRCTWTTPSTGQKPSARQGPRVPHLGRDRLNQTKQSCHNCDSCCPAESGRRTHTPIALHAHKYSSYIGPDQHMQPWFTRLPSYAPSTSSSPISISSLLLHSCLVSRSIISCVP